MISLRSVLFFFFGLCFLNASAQEPLYSEYEKFDFRTGDFAVVGKVNGRLYVYRGSSDGFFLDAYDDNMKRQAVVVLDFFPKKIQEARFIANHDKIVALYQSVEGSRVVQYAALLDGMGKLIKNPVALDSAKMSLFGHGRHYFSSAVSEDKKNIVVYTSHIKGETLDFSGKWIDNELNVRKTVSTGFTTANNIADGEGMLANDGTFFLPVYTPVGSRQFADQLWLLSLSPDGSKFEEHELPLNGKYAAGTYMKNDNSRGRIYIGGFYSDKKNGNYEGVLYTYYNQATGNFENLKNIPFDERLRNRSGERNKKRAFNDYQVKQIIVKNNGGFVLIAEDFYITTRNSYASGYGYYNWYYPSMSASVREYHYEDILAMSYNAEGNMEWHTFIRKDQYSQEDGGLFSSFALVNTGGTLGFLFNDFNAARSRIQLASVDGDGKLSMRSLATASADEPDWLPRSGKQVSAREMIVPCLRKKQICFAKIVF